MDIISGHNYNWQTYWSGLSIMKNTGDGVFYLEDSLFFYGGQIISCDQLDNNSYPELIFMKWNATQFIGLLYNNNFSDTLFLNTNSSEGANYIASGDIDNNNFRDILFCSNSGQFWGIFYNNGDKTFSFPEFHNLTGYYPLDIACGDLNGDDREDVVVSGQDMEIFYSFPSGFQKEIYPMAQKDMLEITDFNADGYNDLVTAADLSLINITSMVIYKNQSDTNLQVLPEVYFNPGSTDFSVNDINNDELPDISFLSYFPDTSGTGIPDTTSGIYILYNQGNFLLSAPHFIPLNNFGEAWRHFHSADIDGNNYNDLIVVRTFAGHLSGNLEILFNDGKGNFVSTPLNVESINYQDTMASLRCFPNPFADRTQIWYKVNYYAHVKIIFRDISGKEIKLLDLGQKDKGTFQYNLFNNDLVAGIYFYSLILDDKISDTRKMSVVR